MDVLTATEVDRRAWAVEQANRTLAASQGMALAGGSTFVASDPTAWVLHAANQLLAYLDVPVARVNSKLLDAARGYDGTQNAAALIGALADALEAR